MELLVIAAAIAFFEFAAARWGVDTRDNFRVRYAIPSSARVAGVSW